MNWKIGCRTSIHCHRPSFKSRYSTVCNINPQFRLSESELLQKDFKRNIRDDDQYNRFSCSDWNVGQCENRMRKGCLQQKWVGYGRIAAVTWPHRIRNDDIRQALCSQSRPAKTSMVPACRKNDNDNDNWPSFTQCTTCQIWKKGNKGRPRLRWIDNVNKDIESIGLT